MRRGDSCADRGSARARVDTRVHWNGAIKRASTLMLTTFFALVLATAVSTAAAVRSQPVPRVVALGDSLTSGRGIGAASAYPALLQRRAAAKGVDYQFVNAGVSGDTSAGGL